MYGFGQDIVLTFRRKYKGAFSKMVRTVNGRAIDGITSRLSAISYLATASMVAKSCRLTVFSIHVCLSLPNKSRVRIRSGFWSTLQG